jgi:effector-binding domain-containing protein
VAVPIATSFEAEPPIRVRILPPEKIVSIIQTGPYEGVASAIESLAAWVAGSGYEPAAPLRVVYLRFAAEAELDVPDRFLTDRTGEFVTEIQQPIKG